ncbi:MAG TPA: tetratricopeptide repeat protein [Gammaproteobacteria bacterium]|nr:tetratricopeptide repeat protein [Gammaproteobacteria bacterium]
MTRRALKVTALSGACAAAFLAGCASDPARNTLADLREVQPDVAEVDVQNSLDLAMASYRRYLEQSSTSAMTPEAMRRLADLQLEKEYGLTGGKASAARRPELAAPGGAARPAAELAAPAAQTFADEKRPEASSAAPAPAESDADFEARATEVHAFAAAGEAPASLPGGADASQGGPLEAIAIYKRLLAEYPNYERRDQVVYQMARAYDELGETEQAMEAMQRLVDEFGYSKYADEVQFRRAEFFFTRSKYRDAEAAYQAITAKGAQSEYYELALYKLGWTLYKQDFYEEALHQYMALLDYKQSIGYDFDAQHEEDDEKRVADTFRVISLSFSNLGSGPEVLPEYYTTYGGREYEDRIYKNMGEFYLEKLRYQDAAKTFELFVDGHQLHRAAPRFSMRVIEVYEKGDFPKLVVDSKKAFAKQYGLKAEYWRHFDVAESPEVLGYLKTNLKDLANHYHSLYQDETLKAEKGANYREALAWYREYLGSFPKEPESPSINYQVADLLLENQDFGEAAREYERTAYEYPAHERASAAGYAAIYAHREELKVIGEAERPQAARATVDSSLKFADTVPEHEHAATILGAAAQDLYEMKDFAPAAAAGRKLVERYPTAEPALRRSAWTVVAHSSFELQDFPAAESAYARVLELVPADDAERQSLVDNLAASIYKQGEQANAAGDYRAAANHFLRLKEAAPTSGVRPAAEYDAAAALLKLEDWTAAAKVLDEFRTAFPNHELQGEATKQLAFAYRQSGESSLAAGEYERVASEAADPELGREALLTAGELYEKAADVERAMAAYVRYVGQYPHPVETALETRFKLAHMYEGRGDRAAYEQELREIVKGDAGAGGERTDRTKYLAAQSGLVLAKQVYDRFVDVRLVQPFDKSLKLKRERMDAALQAFEDLTDYEVAEVTSAATYYMAETYWGLNRSLLESERPKDLDTAAMADYQDALEEQAFPFEEQAIDVHEKNRELIAAGVYNDWTKRSLERLAVLVPGRYAKAEVSSGFIPAIDVYAYRAPVLDAAPAAVAQSAPEPAGSTTAGAATDGATNEAAQSDEGSVRQAAAPEAGNVAL